MEEFYQSVIISALRSARGLAQSKTLRESWGFGRSARFWSAPASGTFFRGLTPARHQLPPAQPLQQLSMNPAKSAIAEHTDNIPTLDIFGDVIDDGVHIRQVSGAFT
jgi:hypothetical protein